MRIRVPVGRLPLPLPLPLLRHQEGTGVALVAIEMPVNALGPHHAMVSSMTLMAINENDSLPTPHFL